MRKWERVGVLFGGNSPEREVSLVSGQHVHAALEGLGYPVLAVEIDNLDDLVPSLRGVDCVFNCLHGGSGEDGTVQLLLDVLGVPYAGSDPRASAICMDKPRAKTVLASKGLAVPREHLFHGESLEDFCEAARNELGFPLVLKPWDQGSSLGVRIVDEEPMLTPFASQILSEFGALFAEEYIYGRDLTVGVLLIDEEERALPLVEMRPKSYFYDYEAKYTKGMTELFVPAPLDEKTTQRVQEAALTAHHALGCYGFSRVDLRLGEDGVPYLLEVNTLPGMTPTSNLPQAAAVLGIAFPQLVEVMLQTAF